VLSQFALLASPASATDPTVTTITGINLNNANLSSFTTSDNPILVDANTYNANVTVYLTNSGESVSNVTGTAGDASAISWDKTFQQGVAVNLSLSNLEPGINRINITVLASNGTTSQVYTYYVNDPNGSSSYSLFYIANLPACQSKQNHVHYLQGRYDDNYCQYTQQGIPQSSLLTGTAQLVQNPNNTYRGYRFEKWTTLVGGGGTAYYPGQTINPPLTGDFKLYAQYTQNPSTTLVLTSNNANVLPTKLDNPGPSVTFTATEYENADVVGDNGTLVTLLLNSAIIPNLSTSNPQRNYTCTLSGGSCSITVSLPNGSDVYSAYVDGSATWFSATSNNLSYYVKEPQTITLANANSSSHWAGSAAAGYTDSFVRGSTYLATTPTDGDTVARNAPGSTYTSGSADTFAFSVNSAGTTGCTINSDGSGLAATASGTCVIGIAATNTDGYFNSATQTLTLTVTPPAAVITVTSTKPTSPVIGTNAYTPAGTSTSGLSVTYGVSTPSVCSISTGVVAFFHVGTCTVTYNDAGNADYSAAVQVTEDITVTQATAVITPDASQSGAVTGGSLTSSATSTSGNTVVVAGTTPLVCTVSGGVVSYIGAGTCSLTYNDVGNSDYAAATQATLDITVAKGTAVITVNKTLPSHLYVYGSYTPNATSNSSDNVTLVSSTLSICTVSVGVVSFIGVGTCTLTYSDVGNSNYNAATDVVQTFNVEKVQAVISLEHSAPGSPALNSTYTPNATSTSAETVVLVSTTTGVCTVSSGVVTFLHPGTCTLTFDDLGNANYSVADTKTVNITVPKLANTITVTSAAPSGPVVGATYTPVATATSGLAVAVSTSTSDICSVTAGVVTFKNVGTCVVKFDEPGNSTYDVATTKTQSITVTQATAVITPDASQSGAVTGGSLTSSATSTSGNTVVVAGTTPLVCTVSGGVVSYIGAGTCSLTYNDVGNSDYAAATQATLDITVAKGTAVITVNKTLPSHLYVYGSYTPNATSNSSDNVTLVSSTLSICTVSVGVVSFIGVGTCTLTYSDVGNSNYNAATDVVQTFNVEKVQAVISLEHSAPGSPALNSTYTPNATSTSAETVVLVSTTTGVCTVSSGVVTFLHPGTCTLTFDDLGNANYSVADTKTVNITVPKLANTITVTSAAPSGPVVGATYTPVATATSGLAVAVSTSTSDICSVTAGVVTFKNVGTCVVKFDEPGNSTYDVATTKTQSITVNKAVAVISFGTAAPTHAYMGGSYHPSAVSTSGEMVVQATVTPEVCSVANGVVYFLALGTCTVTYEDLGNTHYSAATTLTQNFTVEVINVTYFANGAAGSVPVDVNTYITATLVHVLGNFGSPVLTRTGYTFTGWCTTSTSFTTCTDGTFYAVGFQFAVSSAEALYAQWARAVPTVSLTVGPTNGVVGVALVLSPSVGTNAGAHYTVANGTARGCKMTGNIISATSAGTCMVTFTRNGTTVHQTITFGTPTVAKGALFSQVFFGDMLWALTSQSVSTLTTAALEIISKHLKVVTVTGYASALGSAAYNKKLSATRATTVANYLKAILVAAGYPSIQVKIIGEGASTKNPLYALNREVIVRG
jgi:outer membrane protein OmpA-like peptidoglycan-associated protein